MAIALNGLDQDMMQRNLACSDFRNCRKNMITSGIMQFFVIALFLMLGTLLVIYIDNTPGLDIPEKSDEIFGLVVSHPSLPVITGVLFITGLVAAAYSAAGSALVSLTTSFTVDILDGTGMEDTRLAHMRSRVHIAMAVTMGCVIILFHILNEDDAISAVYTLASYTYGPILGLFAFGMFSRRSVNDRMVPVICIAAPVICYVIKHTLGKAYGYEMSFELIILNAVITCAGLALMSTKHTEATESIQAR